PGGEDRARHGVRGRTERRGFENGAQRDYDRSTWDPLTADPAGAGPPARPPAAPGRARPPSPSPQERPAMIRPRLALATFALLALGAAAGADAAEFVQPLLAQSAAIASSRGPGFYLNLLKFLPVLAIYLLWAWTTYWVDDDMRELNNLRFELWN